MAVLGDGGEYAHAFVKCQCRGGNGRCLFNASTLCHAVRPLGTGEHVCFGMEADHRDPANTHAPAPVEEVKRDEIRGSWLSTWPVFAAVVIVGVLLVIAGDLDTQAAIERDRALRGGGGSSTTWIRIDGRECKATIQGEANR